MYEENWDMCPVFIITYSTLVTALHLYLLVEITFTIGNSYYIHNMKDYYE